MHPANSNHPWILGPYAVYADNLHTARQIRDLIASQNEHPSSGTIMLETGEEIDWVDMRPPSPRIGEQ